MDGDVYLCQYCGGLIIFRYGEERQPFHLGTGWDCWKGQYNGFGGTGDPINLSGLGNRGRKGK